MNKKNKQGKMSILGLFIIMTTILVFIIGLGVLMFASNAVNDALDVDEMVGQVNLSEATQATWGQFNKGLANSANLFGIMLIFGLVIGLLIVAYFNRGKNPLLFFIIDILLIFVAFIVAGYISDSYGILLGVSEFNEAFVQNMNLVAKLMLNLPIVVLVTGVLTMIISYAGLPREKEEQMAGF